MSENTLSLYSLFIVTEYYAFSLIVTYLLHSKPDFHTISLGHMKMFSNSTFTFNCVISDRAFDFEHFQSDALVYLTAHFQQQSDNLIYIGECRRK